ncbi:isopentenyl-diphosphate Delta-isomerase [Pseudaestuariivita atlantica]|uniref:Isopentenyl-diphosphate Delta-isomerase n=1 Tax=Pseudaestuariivita atlantica TaxID=1317121 RepID=A0A0L1JQQ1_9RHOB|nr:isopentenyl-diphosphate Delta-isomerase [Pseudaestuariivita atlantica]KNG93743.1 isopentenyl-diphosphate delta-isomerase [Pseudaestuariivita atlantica]
MTIMIPAWVDGEITPVEKLEVHERGLRHKAVSVFVMDGDRVLLQRRALSKYHTPGLWANTCCTHPDFGETAEACAERRLFEELGIAGVSPVHCGQVEYRAEVGNGLIEHEVVEIFRCDASASLDVLPNPDEVMDVRWVSLDDLDRDIAANPAVFTPWLRIYLAEHRDLILPVTV